MTTDEALRLIRSHVETQFPKRCTGCGVEFATLTAYVRETRHVGLPVSYDADADDWTPDNPIGTVALANCPCGTTLAIGSRGMPVPDLVRLMAWARIESVRRGESTSELLAWVRAEIERQVLAES